MSKSTLRRHFNLTRLAVLFTVMFLGFDLAISWILTDPQRRIYSDVIAPLVDLLASMALFIAAWRYATHSRRHAIAWTMIGMSTFAYVLGDTTWGVLELGLKEPPFPSLADAFYIANYPLLLIGVFLLPNKPDSWSDEIKKVLDAGIVMVAASLGFWNFLIGPMVSANSTYPFLEQIILLAYPAGDLVLLWALLRIIYRGYDQPNEVPTFLLAGSIAITIVADCIYSYQALMGTYTSGGILDISWRAAVLLTGLAGVSQISAIQSLRRTGEFPRRLEVIIRNVKRITPYLSYLWLFAAYILLIRSRLVPLPMDFLSLSLAVGGIIGLVFLRQVVTLFENNKLNSRLQIQTRELERTNQELHNEIIDRKTAERQLTYDSLHDAMTGLPNRVLFLDRLGQVMENSKRHSEYIFAVLFVDIDQFKIINDSLGHLTGDQLLISIANRMKACLRSSDTVARFGGDEFAILLEVAGGRESAAIIAQKIQEAIKLPLDLDGHELYTTASMGIVSNVMGYEHPEEVLRDADIAMYQAKASGKARFEIFDVAMRSQAFSRLELEQELRTALENGEFQLYYQPILSMVSNQVTSFEALIRWLHPRRGLLLPVEFLSIAEESGLILPLGKWILNEACQQLMKWHQKHPSLQSVSINVNVSNRQFSQPNFVESVIETLQTSGLKAASLKLEITETVLISNYAAANEVFSQLRNLGIQLQIDDFGSGYSALSYLQHFPISAVKIDKSFIDEMGKGHRGIELIRAIVSMAHELGMDAIAEGIETQEQLHGIKNLACGFGQGFLLSKPLSREAAETILAKQEDQMLGSAIA